MMNLLGKMLVELRALRKLSSKELALRAGVDPSYITALEKGRRTKPSADVVQRLALALNLSAVQTAALQNAAIKTALLDAFNALDYRTSIVDLAEQLLLVGDDLEAQQLQHFQNVLECHILAKRTRRAHNAVANYVD